MSSRFLRPKYVAQAAIVGGLALASSNAFAELLGYQFIDVNGASRVVDSGATHINPEGEISFYLRAGVDRRLQIELLSDRERVLQVQTSDLIGASDRIEHGGSTHYGKILRMNAPEDGSYLLKSSILSSGGGVITEEVLPVNVYRGVPTAGNIEFSTSIGTYENDHGLPILGGTYFQGFGVVGIESEIELSHVNFRLINENGSLYKDVDITINDNSASLSRDILPSNSWQKMLLETRVFDAAGNFTEQSKEFYLSNGDHNNYSIVGVYDPTTFNGQPLADGQVIEGYIPYESGMSVNENPVKFLAKIPKEYYQSYSPYGVGLQLGGDPHIQRTPIKETSSHVYAPTRQNRSLINHGETTIQIRGWDRMRNSNAMNVRVSLSESAIIAPRLSRAEMQYDDIGFTTGHRKFSLSDQNVNLIGARMTVEPRPYRQRAVFDLSGSNAYGRQTVYVEPGETEAIVSLNYNRVADAVNHPSSVASAIYFVVYGEGAASGLNTSTTKHIWMEYDVTPPEINYLTIEPNLISVNAHETDEDRVSSSTRWRNYYVDSSSSTIELSNGSTSVQVNSSGEVAHSHWNRDVLFSLNRVPEGKYTRTTAHIHDSHGNVATKTFNEEFIVDRTPPVLNINHNEVIQSLDDIIIQVTDNIDSSPRVTNARIYGGPAGDDINLATVLQPGSVPTFSLEYPVIFPSLTEDETYRLEVTARDASGNENVEVTTFTYSPTIISLATADENAVRIPARAAAFLRSNGGEVIQTDPLKLSDGSNVAGTYDVFATLRSDAEVPLIINGVRVTPGDTQEIMGRHDFSTSGGRLSIPVMPAEDGIIGTSSILVNTTAPNAPVLLVDIETWEGRGSLSGTNLEARQVIDLVRLVANPSPTTFCRFTMRESESRRSDAVTAPVCYLEWDRLPDEVYPIESRVNEVDAPTIKGVGTRVGAQPIAYSLYMYDSGGQKVKVGGGNETLNVVSAMNAMVYETDSDYSEVDRVLHEFDLRMSQTSGPTCTPTLTESLARQAAERNGYDSSRRSCFFEWSPVPSGLNQAQGTDIPQLTGFIGSNGQHTLGWKAYIYSPEGFKAPVTQQTLEITVKDPEAPTIELDSEYHHEDNLYVVPQNRSSLGGLTIDGLPTDIRVDLRRGQEQIENEVYQAGWGARNRLIRNLRTSHQPVWGETVHQVAAIYEKVPDLRTDASYRVVAAPSDSIQPLVELDSDTVLDTEPLKVRVKVRNMMDFDGDYVPEEMGLWNVRLLNQQSFSNQEPLTEFVEAVNGEFEFEIEMERLSDAGLRLVAEAQLISPIEGYERTVVSRPIYVQVLRGGAIEGDITSRQFTGPAPLTAIFRIALEDRLDQQALGDVVWQISTDDGSTWEEQEIDPRRPMQFNRSFDEGTYLLRAYLHNSNSGAESYTEQVEIVSYAQPEVTINGPGVLFVGDSYTYVAEVEVSEDAIKTADEAVVDWSLDGGKTWPYTGRELELHSDTEDRFPMRARTRMPEAPADDRYAYREGRLNVDFRNVVSPRVRVRTPTSLEQGIPYTVSATASVPYRGMEYDINGYFTLPDGTRQEGDVIEYTPTAADSDLGSATFLYTAWIEGFKDETTATGDRKSRVWQYVWPEFYFTDRVSAPAAPAEVSLSVRHRNGARRLDEPTYNWVLPDAIDELQERGDFTRRFMITEPGTHRIQVEVSDARGHTTTVEQVIELAEPDPYDITLRYTPSNSFMREPLDVRLRPIYRGGHPHDRVNNQRFRVNGDVISEGSNSAVASLNAGRHEVIFEIETSYGVVDEERVFIDVAENQVPTCELETSESSRNWIIRANCVDVDGRVTKYHWMVDGEESARTSNRLGISKKDFDDVMPEVILIAVDDSGGASDPISVQ